MAVQPVTLIETPPKRKARFSSLQARLIASHWIVLLLALALVLLISAAYLRRLEHTAERQRLAQLAVPLTAEVNSLRSATRPTAASARISAIDAQAAAMKVRLLIVETDGMVWYDTADTKDLTGAALPGLVDPIAALMKQAKKKASVQTAFVNPSATTGAIKNGIVLVAAGPTGLLPAHRALVIVAPDRRFPLAGLYLPRLLLVAAVSLVIASIAGYLLSRRIAEPVGELTGAADAMAAGELAQFVSGEGDDEIGRLVASFNSMSHRVASLAQNQRELLANVAHELRTPLTSVQGYARALKDGVITDPNEREKALGTITRESERMAGLIGQLLDLARLSSGQSQLTIAPVSASGLLNRVAEQFRPQALDKQVAIETRTLEGLAISGDEPRLVQIVSNLVANALRHTPSGGSVALSAASVITPGAQPASMVRLSVADTGEGMSPEQVSRVFERFTRGDGIRLDDRSGFGLGLAIVSELVQLHDGSVSVISAPGQGSTFMVDLPAAQT